MKFSIITIYTLAITTISATFLPSTSNKLLEHNLRAIEHTTPILKQSALNEIQSQNTGAIATELKFDYRLEQVKNINDWNSLNEDLITANKKVKKERLDIDIMTIQREFVQLQEELKEYKSKHFEGKRSLVSRSKKRVRKFLNKQAKRLS